jgi:hypothetical protein
MVKEQNAWLKRREQENRREERGKKTQCKFYEDDVTI